MIRPVPAILLLAERYPGDTRKRPDVERGALKATGTSDEP
jgi:hypothetical protein